jgi:hypothetical protein
MRQVLYLIITKKHSFSLSERPFGLKQMKLALSGTRHSPRQDRQKSCHVRSKGIFQSDLPIIWWTALET